MGTVARAEKQGQEQWWYVADLIAGIAATPTQKYLLALIHRHTHSRKGYAWASQESLAWEMGVDLSTVKRVFRWGKQLGVVGVRRIRTGKGKDDQYNEYWLELERLKELQRPRKQGAFTHHAQDEHSAPTPHAQNRAGVKSDTSKGQIATEQGSFDTGAGGMGDPEGLEVKHRESNAGREHIRGNGSLRSPAPGNVSPELQPQFDAMVDHLIGMLASSKYRESAQEKQRTLEVAYDFFKRSANAIGMDFGTMTELYNLIVKEYFAPPAQPEEKPAPKKNQKPKTARKPYDHARSHQFWLAAGVHGTEYLKKTFGVPSPSHLTNEQFEIAMRHFQSSQRVN